MRARICLEVPPQLHLLRFFPQELERQLAEWKNKCEMIEKRESERRAQDDKKHAEEARAQADSTWRMDLCYPEFVCCRLSPPLRFFSPASACTRAEQPCSVTAIHNALSPAGGLPHEAEQAAQGAARGLPGPGEEVSGTHSNTNGREGG